VKDRDIFFLKDIIRAISLVEEFVNDLNFSEFFNDEKTKSAVLWQIHIIGEATKNISKELKEEYKEIPWKYMAKMRDKIAHFYFGIDYEIVWDVIKNKLPSVKILIKKVIK